MTLTRRGTILSGLAASVAGPLAAGAQGRAALTMATAGRGSAFLPFGEVAAAVVARLAPIDISLRETKGSNENAELVNSGAVQLATLNLGPGFDAWNGQGPFSGRRLRALRAIAPMYETPFHTIALRGSGIGSIRDLAGKRVGVGPAGGPGEVFYKGLAEALGIASTLVPGTPAELAAKVASREIDAFWYGSGLPSPPFTELTTKVDAAVIGLRADEAEAFQRRFPYFAPYVIPAGTYEGQASPLPSMAVWNFVVANEALADEVGHALTRALLEGVDEIAARFKAAAAMRAANASANTFMPFHPGAARYYRERGVVLPTLPGG